MRLSPAPAAYLPYPSPVLMPLCRHLCGPSCRAALAIGRHLLHVPCILPAPASRPVRTVPGVNVTSRTDDVRRHSHRTSSPVVRLEDRDGDNIVAMPSSSLSATEKHSADLRHATRTHALPGHRRTDAIPSEARRPPSIAAAFHLGKQIDWTSCVYDLTTNSCFVAQPSTIARAARACPTDSDLRAG
ncbi:hypothetical protein B0H17DRAFT_1197446 [Mycena rosella]|uniref:Uncharacterized protein n=1 Tax=Mycena rosella TaxID=1033263 RepID=A0AAD7GJA7_MYCRO|nr:hypothetical protein B0H17DRAFT_1197446 [Mycena rosella]